MARAKVDPVEKVKKCIDKCESFILQGGAGSGKTETLKKAIEYTLSNDNNKVLCITHTNAAVNEIKKRVEGKCDIFTIHSFLNNLVKNFKINIKDELISINKLETVPNVDSSQYEKEGKDYMKERYEKYKDIYQKYNIQLYKRNGETLGKVERKTTYDKKYIKNDNFIFNEYDVSLNSRIIQMNVKIEEELKRIPSHKVHYSNKKFDVAENLAYGHDSLLLIATHLINKYPKLQRILRNNYNYIFIDEYQDTNPNVLEAFINKFIGENNTIGLFGDSMQSIYDDGIGDVNSFTERGKLIKIEKEDNFRSSYEVVDFINKIRTDGLVQEVELKDNEKENNRFGNVEFHYIIHEFTSKEREDKNTLINKVKQHVLKAKDNFVLLELSNSAIAQEMGYTSLYSFYKTLPDVNEAIYEDLSQLQLVELYEIITAFSDGNHNMVIEYLKYNGWILRKISDKKNIIRVLKSFTEKDLSVNEALSLAFDNKVLNKSDGYKNFDSRIKLFFKNLETKEHYTKFKELKNSGKNTFTRFQKESTVIESEEQFNEYSYLLDKENKYTYLMSNHFKLSEAFNFLKYQLDKNNVSTMHRTKGEGIENVAVMLDNYGWNKYNFDKMYDESYSHEVVKSRTQKLFYVACSRAEKNLMLIKIMKNKEELEIFKQKFGAELFQEVELDSIMEIV